MQRFLYSQNATLAALTASVEGCTSISRGFAHTYGYQTKRSFNLERIFLGGQEKTFQLVCVRACVYILAMHFPVPQS
jgi:hypothetical protein